MILCDMHTHTTYCDGQNTPEEMIEEAIKKGLQKSDFRGIATHILTRAFA